MYNASRRADHTQRVGNPWSRAGALITPAFLYTRGNNTMKTNEILTLLQAGYTKADIDLLEALEVPKETPAAAPTENAAAAVPDQTPDQDTESGSDIMNTVNELSDSIKALQETITAMQKQNIQNADSGKDPNKRMTTKEALASFFGSPERPQKE